MIDFTKLKDGDGFNHVVKIIKKVVIGPTIFVISDGKNTMDAVTKESNFKVGDVVNIKGFVSTFRDKLRVDIKFMNKADEDFDKIIEEKSKPENRLSSIMSSKYDKLKPYFLDIAGKVRKAIFKGQPILIRHHADCDGFISGLSMAKAISMLMEEVGINPEYNLYRSPSKAPFYETVDMFKDLVLFDRIESKDKTGLKPLILVLDNGSTPEDVFAHKSLHSLGYEIIVIDHHDPVEMENKITSVCPYLIAHVNPYMEGFDGNLCAGMLSYEVARLINTNFEHSSYPAVAGVADRCEGEEVEKYINRSKLPLDKLQKIAGAIDYFAYNLKFDSGRNIMDNLFNNDSFLDIIDQQINSNVEEQLNNVKPHLQTKLLTKVAFSTIDIENNASRSLYPPPGKLTGILHDEVAIANPDKVTFTIGYLSDIAIIRATQAILPVPKLVEELKQEFPLANVDGGGHECAGSIKFNKNYLEKIFAFIEGKLSSI